MSGEFVSRSRYNREKLARESAERLLEEKSRQLYLLNVELRNKSDSLAVQVDERTADLSRALRAARTASRAKDLFLANMSHEVRTPLTGIMGIAQLLAESDLTSEQQELLGNLQESCQSLKHIIDDMLDLKSLERGKVKFRKEPFSPREVIEAMIMRYESSAQRNGNRLSHVTSLAPDDLRVGDRTRFEQVVANLLTNALKFTQNGVVEVTSNTVGTDVSVVVSDTGIGIQADQLERIFEDFTQADDDISARFGGTGLGLSIVRMIMRQFGGSVSVTSELGRGSIFTLVFPLAEVRPELLQEQGICSRRADGLLLHGKRILLAEDNRINAKVIRSFLAKYGGEAVLAANGSEALYRTSRQAFDILIFDINMPDIGGVELLRRIRTTEACAMNSTTPAIACTANAMPDQIAGYLECGFSAVVRKPLDADEFMSSLTAGLTA